MPNNRLPKDPVLPATAKRMAKVAQRNNSSEKDLRSELHKRGLRFRIHRRLVTNTRRTVDIVFASAKIAVFVDGCFWHGCPQHRTYPKNNAEWWEQKINGNIARDLDTDAKLAELGWTVIRVWEHESPSRAADRIEANVRLRLLKRENQTLIT